jgi:hypothetical protein
MKNEIKNKIIELYEKKSNNKYQIFDNKVFTVNTEVYDYENNRATYIAFEHDSLIEYVVIIDGTRDTITGEYELLIFSRKI